MKIVRLFVRLLWVSAILTALAGCAGTSSRYTLEPLPPAADSPSGAPPAEENVPTMTKEEEIELKKEPPRPKFNLSGFPLPYRQGYHDGCASAEGVEQKNEARFAKDTDYRLGWQDGFSLCQPKTNP